jgi:DNA invertase Pin-like site-specific DNA recombinase
MIGYARVSATDEHLNLQRDALKAAGCRKIFADRGVSGSAVTRPQLARALEALRPGDTLVVWKLDRLGRSLSHLVMTMADLGKRGVNFRSLTESIDTDSAGGRFMLHSMAALAEFERSLRVERTRAGLDAATKRGIKLGRTPRLDEKKVAKARCLLEGGQSPGDVARILRVARSTLYESLRRSELTKNRDHRTDA